MKKTCSVMAAAVAALALSAAAGAQEVHNWRASDGSQCRQDSFGNWRCHGEEAAPPAVYDSDDDEDEPDVQDDD